MAKISFKNSEKFFSQLQSLERTYAKDETLEKAVHAGAAIVADKIRDNLEALPEEPFKRLQPGEIFHGIPKGQKKDLVDSFGLTPIDRDRAGFVHTKAGFDGYGSYPTETYPEGVPNQLVAAAAESGSSVRAKTPFVRPAVNATRKKAIEAMEKVVDEQTKDIFEGG